MNMPEFPEDTQVEVRYPLTPEQEHGDRGAWPWLPGEVVARAGADEWQILVTAAELAAEEHGEITFPLCFRDASEIREPEAGQ